MPAVTGLSSASSREKLLAIARSLPADLHVLSLLGTMLQDINSELDEIAELLRRDVALAARIVRISNSPLYGSGSRIASIEEAVNRVGFAEILKLVGTATAARFSERPLEHYDVSGEKLRSNMLYGALASEALARTTGLDPRTAYTAGLLRPLGLMVLDRAGRGLLAHHQAYTPSQWPSYSAWEGSIFGIDSCEVAALILEEWRFPRELSGTIRAHHLSRPGDFERPSAAVLNLANGLTHCATHSLPGEVKWWDITEAKLTAAGVTVDDLEPAIASAETAFAAALSTLMM